MFDLVCHTCHCSSLGNMYKELKADVEGFVIPNHGTLSGWAKQGVLLLNACLTVEKGKANAHKGKGWEKLTDAIVQYLNDRSANIVFLLWGRDAQNKGARINKARHHVLTAAHPSPLSAHNGFMGCKVSITRASFDHRSSLSLYSISPKPTPISNPTVYPRSIGPTCRPKTSYPWTSPIVELSHM